MPEQQEILCETCGQRPARVFSTQCTVTPGADSKIVRKSALCEACANEDPLAGLSRHAMEAGCVYCGTPAASGGGYGGSFKAECGSCFAAEHAFIMKSFGANSREEFLSVIEAMSPEARAEAFRDVGNVDEYMRARRTRYECEAYLFVKEAADQGPPLAAVELLEVIRLLAIERYGFQARAQLAAWGVTRCEDFGVIVFRLAEEGILNLTLADGQEDFSSGYDFESAFPEC